MKVSKFDVWMLICDGEILYTCPGKTFDDVWFFAYEDFLRKCSPPEDVSRTDFINGLANMGVYAAKVMIAVDD